MDIEYNLALLEVGIKNANPVEVPFLKMQEKNRLVKHCAGGEFRKFIFNGFLPQHLFLLSNEVIKDGDYAYNIYHPNEGILLIGESVTLDYVSIRKQYKKIIASTYPKLKNVPGLSDDFIKLYVTTYNSGLSVENIEIEFEGFECVNKHYMNYQTTCVYPHCKQMNYPKIKINSDNKIFLSLKIEKNYSRDQVIGFLKDFRNGLLPVNEREIKITNNFIKENL